MRHCIDNLFDEDQLGKGGSVRQLGFPVVCGCTRMDSKKRCERRTKSSERPVAMKAYKVDTDL